MRPPRVDIPDASAAATQQPQARPLVASRSAHEFTRVGACTKGAHPVPYLAVAMVTIELQSEHGYLLMVAAAVALEVRAVC